MPGLTPKSSEDKRAASSARRPARSAVEFVLRGRQEFVQSFDTTSPHGGVFCPTRKKLTVGTGVSVTVRLGRRQPPVVLQGLVAWRRPGRHLEKIRAGIGIDFLPGERIKCDYILELATAGGTARSRRRHERLAVDLPVSFHLAGTNVFKRGVMRDIGRGGAFVRSPDLFDNDTEVVLEVAPPGAQVAMAFTARIAWCRRNGGESGFGVEWRARDAGGGKRIKELVRRLAADTTVVVPPDGGGVSS